MLLVSGGVVYVIYFAFLLLEQLKKKDSKMKRFLLLIVFTLAMTMVHGQAAAFDLINAGKAVSVIVIKEDAAPPVQFAGKELSAFLAKISAGESVKIVSEKKSTLYNIILGTVIDKEICEAAKIDPTPLKEGGFAITANKEALYIIGGDPLGTLYGSYEILKKYGGIRWIFPGAEGEYFQVKKTISVP
ncbi:MAG: alpha-glucuronidase family glycosyl hydrolase, partial [Lentisphaeria bacterium]